MSSLHEQAMLLVVLLPDEAEFNEQWEYLINGMDKTELFQETMALDWLRRYKEKLGLDKLHGNR